MEQKGTNLSLGCKLSAFLEVVGDQLFCVYELLTGEQIGLFAREDILFLQVEQNHQTGAKFVFMVRGYCPGQHTPF